MKTFKDLIHQNIPDMGTHAMLTFDNGYGVSVVRGQYTYGGVEGLYEVAVLDNTGNLTYDTPITDDVLGYLTEEDVTKIMVKVQEL